LDRSLATVEKMQANQAILDRARLFREEAFDFVRAGLAHTCERLHGKPVEIDNDENARHVSGQDLCQGLRELAVDRYGLLARTVLTRWGLRCTDDFGVIVYALIECGELRSSENDSIDDFRGVFDFGTAFPEPSDN
jgi:uncharacterized repeat protein (TIGR04138 family)